MQDYADFSEWYEDQSEENKKLIEKLRVIIEQTAPHLTTTVKGGKVAGWMAVAQQGHRTIFDIVQRPNLLPEVKGGVMLTSIEKQ